jgi:hypothetical protein
MVRSGETITRKGSHRPCRSIRNGRIDYRTTFFGVDTPLGPLYLAYGEGGEHQGYLYLGKSF